MRLKAKNSASQSFSQRVRTHLINSNKNKYFIRTAEGVVPKSAAVNVDLAKLEKHFKEKFPAELEVVSTLFENIIAGYDRANAPQSPMASTSTNPTRRLLEVNSLMAVKFPRLSDNLYRTFAHFETNLKTLKNEQVKLSSAVDSLENVHVNNCKNWTFGLSCDEWACVQLHSEFCDKINGQCHCKQGYTGDACQCKDNGGPCQHHIRLVNADNITSMGRVEVVTNGVWSTVCDEDWDHDDATVVCKQLGLGMNGIGVSHAPFGKGIGPNFISKVDCKGNETDVFNCSFVKLSCSHANDAGVICVNKSDSIRLVNGSFATNGRLEVRLEGRGPWATVCDDGFTKNDARVACRELGLPT
uniref:SRCR domain-containing protein n=1 Tax=Magallana gigas TaxID=29159 RepID=K1QUR6_MAGGI